MEEQRALAAAQALAITREAQRLAAIEEAAARAAEEAAAEAEAAIKSAKEAGTQRATELNRSRTEVGLAQVSCLAAFQAQGIFAVASLSLAAARLPSLLTGFDPASFR